MKAVLSMKLPSEAYTDPALAKAMDDAFILCVRDKKVMI